MDYVGYDLNPRYIASAVKRRGDRGRFFCARVGEMPEETLASGFDRVIASAIIHHLDDAQASTLLDSAHRLLRTGGVLVTLDACVHPGQSAVARLLMGLDRGRNIRTPEASRTLLSHRFRQIETWLLTDLMWVPYSHFVARTRKE